MFFYIGKDCPIKSVEKVADTIYLDKGWKNYNNTHWYKGYSTDCVLGDNISQIIDGYKPAGKWAVISSVGKIYHPILRGFPVYTNEREVKTNIPLDNFVYEHYQTVPVAKQSNKISLDRASILINEVLTENIINFFKYNSIDRLQVLFSGGLDTLTVWSIVDKLGYDYDLHIHTPTYNDIFGVKQEYQSDLIDLCRKKLWGYRITSCFNDENYYLTGFYSERMQLREVTQGHTIANYKNKKLYEMPSRNDYCYYFLQRSKNKINTEPVFTTENEVIDWCNRSIFYDYQMWHIDHNYHFSPFYDLRITEIANQLSMEDIVNNAFDAILQKNIVRYNRPDFLSILANYKNEKNVWENYNKNFNKIVLRESINKFIT